MKEFLFRLKIFIWYVFTEPIRVVKQSIHDMISNVATLRKTKDWTVIYLFLLFISIWAEKKFTTFFCLGILIILWVWNTWQTGFFIHRWRELQKQNGGNKK